MIFKLLIFILFATTAIINIWSINEEPDRFCGISGWIVAILLGMQLFVNSLVP